MRLQTALLLLASVSLAGAQTPDAAPAVLNELIQPRGTGACPAPQQFSMVRPDPPGTPTVVGIAAMFQDIAALNDVDQTVTSDVYLIVRWLDTRLADPNRGVGSVECTAAMKPFWMPALEPENLRSRQRFYEDRMLVNAKGVVTIVRRVFLQMAQPMDFSDFPLDRHKWNFTIWPVFSNSEEIVFHALPWTMGPERPTIQGWRVGKPTGTASIVTRGSRLGTYARFDANLELRRQPEYYLWKLGVPLVLIGMMAYLVYFIPTAMVAQQIALGMTGILTTVAYMLTLSGSLPKIGYLTRADRFFVGVIFLVFLGLLKAILTAILQASERKQWISSMDRWGRLLFPVAAAANFAAAFWW